MLQGPPTQKFVLAEQIWGEEEDGKTAVLTPSILLKTRRKHVPCCVSSLADSQDLTPNIQECPALGKVFFAVRRTDWEECWTSQWTPMSLKKRLFICRQDFCFDLTIRDDFQSVFLNVDNISRGVLQEWWALLCEERRPFICILPLNLQKNPYLAPQKGTFAQGLAGWRHWCQSTPA